MNVIFLALTLVGYRQQAGRGGSSGKKCPQKLIKLSKHFLMFGVFGVPG